MSWCPTSLLAEWALEVSKDIWQKQQAWFWECEKCRTFMSMLRLLTIESMGIKECPSVYIYSTYIVLMCIAHACIVGVLVQAQSVVDCWIHLRLQSCTYGTHMNSKGMWMPMYTNIWNAVLSIGCGQYTFMFNWWPATSTTDGNMYYITLQCKPAHLTLSISISDLILITSFHSIPLVFGLS